MLYSAVSRLKLSVEECNNWLVMSALGTGKRNMAVFVVYLLWTIISTTPSYSTYQTPGQGNKYLNTHCESLWDRGRGAIQNEVDTRFVLFQSLLLTEKTRYLGKHLDVGILASNFPSNSCLLPPCLIVSTSQEHLETCLEPICSCLWIGGTLYKVFRTDKPQIQSLFRCNQKTRKNTDEKKGHCVSRTQFPLMSESLEQAYSLTALVFGIPQYRSHSRRGSHGWNKHMHTCRGESALTTLIQPDRVHKSLGSVLKCRV